MGGSIDDVAARVEQVRGRIHTAALRSGRLETDVMLLAVTKTHPPEAIRAAYAAGVRHFGENRVEEAAGKRPALTELESVVWHMIGQLQSRKAARAGQLFSWVHSVDRAKVAAKLSEAAVANGKHVMILLEVNLSGEMSKSGFDLSGWPDNKSQETEFFRSIESLAQLPNLVISGLMTIPPYDENSERSRPIFARLKSLQGRLMSKYSSLGWDQLSMGMSADFEVAIQEGSTIVRLGTILFGARPG